MLLHVFAVVALESAGGADPSISEARAHQHNIQESEPHTCSMRERVRTCADDHPTVLQDKCGILWVCCHIL